jgi:hypothetical protein
MYEKLMVAIKNLEGQIDTLKTDLQFSREKTLKNMESLYGDVINYAKEYAECLHTSIQVRTD